MAPHQEPERRGVVEGYLPIDNLKLGRDDGREMEQMKALLRHLAELGVPMVCYNFMAGTDWIPGVSGF